MQLDYPELNFDTLWKVFSFLDRPFPAAAVSRLWHRTVAFTAAEKHAKSRGYAWSLFHLLNTNLQNLTPEHLQTLDASGVERETMCTIYAARFPRWRDDEFFTTKNQRTTERFVATVGGYLVRPESFAFIMSGSLHVLDPATRCRIYCTNAARGFDHFPPELLPEVPPYYAVPVWAHMYQSADALPPYFTERAFENLSDITHQVLELTYAREAALNADPASDAWKMPEWIDELELRRCGRALEMSPHTGFTKARRSATEIKLFGAIRLARKAHIEGALAGVGCTNLDDPAALYYAASVSPQEELDLYYSKEKIEIKQPKGYRPYAGDGLRIRMLH